MNKLLVAILLGGTCLIAGCGDGGSDKTVIIEREVEKDKGDSFSLSVDEEGNSSVEINVDDKE